MNTKRKLTTVEKRAQEWCKNRHFGDTIFTVEWRRSREYGHNPVIESNDGKLCSVSGCGYCKLSTALADVLCFLFPVDSEAFNDVARTGGAGVSSVQNALKKHGWTLEQTTSGKSYDVFTIRREST